MDGLFKKYILLLVLFLLQVPALWYAIHSPFGLQICDDYPWISDTWGMFANFFSFEEQRYRPVFCMYRLITWVLFDSSYAWHHFARFVIKFAITVYGIKILRLFRHAESSHFNLPYYVFITIYWLFPNNPEARLAPQELLLVLFLAATLFYVGRAFAEYRGDIITSRSNYIKLLLSFLLLSWSKEPSIVFMMVVLVFVFLLNRSIKGVIKSLPFMVIFVFSLVKVYSISRLGDYGTAPLTVNLIKGNYYCLLDCLSLRQTSFLIPILFVIPILHYIGRNIARSHIAGIPCASATTRAGIWIDNVLSVHKQSSFILFLVANGVAYCLLSLTFWCPSLRYYYPLVLILALIEGMCFVEMKCSTEFRRKIVIGLAVCACLYFILVNYYNFIFQFANPYYGRLNEDKMLSEVAGLIERGRDVYILDDLGVYICVYMRLFQHEYKNDILPTESESKEIKNARYNRNWIKKLYYLRIPEPSPNLVPHGLILAERSSLFADAEYVVTRNKNKLLGHVVYRVIPAATKSSFLMGIERISSYLQFGRPAFYWTDAGTCQTGIGEDDWYIYRNTIKLNPEWKEAPVLFKTDEYFEVVGAKPYAEACISLSFSLSSSKLYVISIQYQTQGKAAPGMVLWQSPDKFALHDSLCNSEIRMDKTMMFSPEKDLASPTILLRNYSGDSRLLVYRIEIKGLTAGQHFSISEGSY